MVIWKCDMEWLEILTARSAEIDGERVEEWDVRYMLRHVNPCPALDALAIMMQRFPIVHARLFFGPPLSNGLGLEHEMSLCDPVALVCDVKGMRPAGFVAQAGYMPFASDADLYDGHYLGPHPDTGELTVLQIFRKKVKGPCDKLSKGQYLVHTPTLADFFRECIFAPQVKYGHPPRK
jgi:hypothetical protein